MRALAAAAMPQARADVLTFSLSPAILGATPGGTVYFGFTLTWQSDTESLIVTNSYLTDESDPALGQYTDTMGQNGYLHILGPSATPVTWSEAGGPGTGAGSYTIDPSASAGDSDAGNLAIDYLIFDNSGSTGGTAQTPFTVNVQAAPEPGTWGLLGIGAAVLAITARRVRRPARGSLPPPAGSVRS
ncbi:MAG TPA: PEP-CTERM sorting domain-containing protein [Bryobacteraceae bacterium]|jgi:hypothetical protein|nr:PEP-CTERM sorting domain-containing protein [Bryobacteraceae bacterium]